MIIKAQFTESGSPKTGLSPTISVYNITDDSLDVNAAAMTEVNAGGGGFYGWYYYNFTTFDDTKVYSIVCDSITLTGSERYAYVNGGDLVSEVADIERLTANKVTKAGDIITIYDNDGVTVWRQYNLANGGRVQV